ncbi:Disease resistance protein RGA2 [Bienertia sinuspersici]
MAEFGILIAEKLIEVIGSEVVKEVCDMWNYKSQLDELKETVSTIHKVLLDADARRELSNADQDYIDKLKDAVYDADDLFDEFLTLAELKQLRPLSKRGKIYEKVRCFFSSKNQLGQAYRMSRDVKHIKKRLGDIADCHKKFGFNVDYKPIIRRREETCSYVDANKIIGRKEDREAIVKMLLDRNDEEVRFTTIVGVGGLGKTALAQLVYHDERINNEFHENMKLWVCVSDQEGEQFDVKTILIKILEQVTKKKKDDSSTLQLVQHQFQEKLRGQKYLLVLDDVWNEDPMKWCNLQEFLTLGQGGSRVMVTTRSMMTAKIIDERHAYELEGLSGEDSWRLFEMSAFDKGIKRENHNEFVEIGKKIVDNCHNNPLALKVVGSLLFGQSISMEKLTSLQVLPYFLVDLVGNTTSQDVEFEAVKCIEGKIKIIIDEDSIKMEGKNGKKGVYLKSVKHVTKVDILYRSRCDSLAGVLEALEPPSNLKKLVIYGYKGEKIPKWGRAMDNWAFSLSCLVEIELSNCQNLEEIPVLSKLPLLKKLCLWRLDKLEYMEEKTSDKSENHCAELFFPSLVSLVTAKLERLKGWWKEDSTSSPSLNGVDDDNRCCLDRRFRFPCLFELRIENCPNLTSFPSCPTTIEELELKTINKRLQIHVDIEDETDGNSKGDFRLWNLKIDNMGNLKSPPLNYLRYLTICKDEEVEDKLSESRKVESQQLQKWAFSLKKLQIPRMNTLRRLFGETGLQHFTALEDLCLGSIEEDKADTEDEFEAFSFPQDLRCLYFSNLQKMTSLPKGMQYLTSLRELSLSDCKNLKALPEWITCLSSLEFLDIYRCLALESLPEVMPQLTSLKTLSIRSCPELQERCKEHDGEDRPKIKHIPDIVYSEGLLLKLNTFYAQKWISLRGYAPMIVVELSISW